MLDEIMHKKDFSNYIYITDLVSRLGNNVFLDSFLETAQGGGEGVSEVFE